MRKIMLLSAVAVLSLLWGCKPAEEKAVTKITLMHGWGGTLQTHALMQEIYDEFSEQNADIELISYPSSDSLIAVEKANNMLAVGKMPDIVSTNGLSYYVLNAVKREKALDLMPYIIQDEELRNNVHPAILESWQTEDGKLYTVPDALEIAGYWYNKKYFKEAGITDGSGNVKTPDTWEAFFEDCERLSEWGRDKNADFTVAALDGDQLGENFFFARLAGCGEEGIKLTETQPADFSDPDIVKTLQDIKKLGSYSGVVDNIENARQSFMDGNTAFYFNGVWESEPLSVCSISGEIGYANYPSEVGKSLSYISPSSGYVFSQSNDTDKLDACIRFLKYMLSEKVQTKIALETGQAPTNPNVSGVEIKEKYPMLGEALELANHADIQIKSIGSEWDTGIVEVLSKGLTDLAQGRLNEKTLINNLNHL